VPHSPLHNSHLQHHSTPLHDLNPFIYDSRPNESAAAAAAAIAAAAAATAAAATAAAAADPQQPPGGLAEGESALERFTNDLTAAARRGQLDPLVGRDGELRRVCQLLLRRTKNNPVLVGEPGVVWGWWFSVSEEALKL
jgi:ATP-dependent Clp protease ATP-binding subunit ClpA